MNLQYAAGFFDGEGCVNFSRVRTSIFPRILVVNTNLEVLQEFQKKFGGDISKLSRAKNSWKVAYQWRLSWATAVDFLEKIYPYLKIKTQQVETVFAWDAVRPGMGNRWDKETTDLLVERLHFLNKKGTHSDIDPIEKELP